LEFRRVLFRSLLARAQGELTVAVRSAVRRESFVSTRLPDRAVPWHLLGLHEGLARTIYTPSANRGWRSAQWHTSRPGGGILWDWRRVLRLSDLSARGRNSEERRFRRDNSLLLRRAYRQCSQRERV